jgi:TRAP transporter TAXI family solute receptor
MSVRVRQTILAALLAFGLLLPLAAAAATVDYKIVTASERGTYIQIGRDLAKFIAPAADINLEVLPSAGSAENVQRLRYEPGVKLALVQSDVYQAFLDQAAAGNGEAGAMIRPLRVVMPLYNEEIYFIARADSKLEYVHDIDGSRVNLGPLRSGTAMSAITIYRQMFGHPIADANASFLSNEDALLKLVGDKSVDVVVVVAGQPAKLLVDMKPEARKLVKLLKFDAQQPGSAAALKTYFPATILAANYPNLLSEDIPGVAVKAFLVTYDYPRADTIQHLTRFAGALCDGFAKLQAEGHPKWREVKLELPPLGRGWAYYPPMERQLRSCIAKNAATAAAVRNKANCTQQEHVLGLCD